jgi:hypothetical protein
MRTGREWRRPWEEGGVRRVVRRGGVASQVPNRVGVLLCPLGTWTDAVLQLGTERRPKEAS